MAGYGVELGGFLPVFLTSFSIVTVVVPPGVVIFVSCFVEAFFSEQPIAPIENRLAISRAMVVYFIL